MSVWSDKFQTLSPGDLTNQTSSSRADTTGLQTENQRLRLENQELRQCLVSMRENASLRTAQVLASIIAWSDEQLTSHMKKLNIMDTFNNNDVQPRPSGPSPFRPISPAVNQSDRISRKTGQQSHIPPDQSDQHPSSLHHQVQQHPNLPQNSSQQSSILPKQSGQHSPVHYQQHNVQANVLEKSGQQHRPSDLHSSTQYQRSDQNSFVMPQQSDQKRLQFGQASNAKTTEKISPNFDTAASDPPPSIEVNKPRSPSPASRRHSSPSPISPSMLTELSAKSPVVQPVAKTKIITNSQMQSVSPSRISADKKRLISDTVGRNISERTNPQDSSSDVDDRLEKLLSRKICPQSSVTMDTPGQDPSSLQMPTASATLGTGDRRTALSAMDHTRSEGYGSVQSSDQQFSGGVSGSVRSDGVHSSGVMKYEVGEPIADHMRRKVMGDPIATSTPLRPPGRPKLRDQEDTYQDSLEPRHPTPQKSQRDKSVTASSNVLHRPIDDVIGFTPVLTENRRQKLSKIKATKRLVGEIAFQLDRRILEYVFSWKFSPVQRKRYYGFSIVNIGNMIRKEAIDENGKFVPKRELEMRYKFEYIIKTLSYFGYNLERHGQFAQDMVNKYGLLSGPPDKQTIKDFGLEDPVILRILLSRLLSDDAELQEELVLLDSLCLLAHDDRKPLFLW